MKKYAYTFLSFAEEGSGKTQTIVSIGDKGRAQLARAEPSLYAMGIADTYKARVTFNQVRVLWLLLPACTVY